MDWSCACFSDSEGVEGLTWAWFWDLEHLPNVERKEEEEARVELGLGTSSFCEEEEKPRPCLTERKIIVERLVKIAEEDNEKLLLKLRERMDRVGLDIPTFEVRFEHINVEAQVYVGGRALPSLLNFFVNVLENDIASGTTRFWKDHFVVIPD